MNAVRTHRKRLNV